MLRCSTAFFKFLALYISHLHPHFLCTSDNLQKRENQVKGIQKSFKQRCLTLFVSKIGETFFRTSEQTNFLSIGSVCGICLLTWTKIPAETAHKRVGRDEYVYCSEVGFTSDLLHSQLCCLSADQSELAFPYQFSTT